MGHVITHKIYDENVNKRKVQAECDHEAMSENQKEGCVGLLKNIWWVDHVCNSYEEARDYIEQHDDGWYDQRAVKFKDAVEVKPSKKLNDLMERKTKQEKLYNELQDRIHYANVTSTLVTCRCCGSKIARDYIGSNLCPVCRTDMRPDSVKDRVKRIKENIISLDKEIKAEEERLQTKARDKVKIKWLVKIEYHV